MFEDSYIILARKDLSDGTEEEHWNVVAEQSLANSLAKTFFERGFIVSMYAGFRCAQRLVPEGVKV